ncbi:disease resistance protein RPM1-like [Primulina eburnea]|uniref:disease resistance protein RPM1-like n=1 Tax=Primulina eburnea TaxID=1245227 RepID=UPI003C6C5A63
MADSAVTFVLNQLSLFLQHEKELLGGVGEEVEYIQGELEHMTAFLRVADSKEESDPQLKAWVNQVRKITYDIEDILQEYMLRFAYPRHGSNEFGGCIKKNLCASVRNLKSRRRIASEIQTIKLRLQNVSKSQQRFKDTHGFMDGSSSSFMSNEWYDSRGDALLLEDSDIVGIEKPKRQLLEWLLPTENGLKVISVVGMGGLGKTTLVKRVYDDASVKANFDSHVWVTIAESFKADHLLQSIIKQLVYEVKQQPPHDLESKNVDEMKEFIYYFLQHKTYIIVLDDVWKIGAWESIRYAFPRLGALGFIIITTRFNSIGNAACSETNGHLYNLEPFDAEESEELFYKKAFPGKSCPPHLKGVSACILKRCEGLPLAIVVIGGLLATKKQIPEEWKMFERNIGLELEGDSMKRMVKLLYLSYYDLPHYLKAYILYMSIFLEFELLEKWRMIRLWIAEGFMELKQGKTEEEMAEAYLNELVSRSLIQVADTYEDGRPRKFRIHDILREYIISKSRERNIFLPASGEKIMWPNKIRRMAIHSAFTNAQESFNVKYLVSLFWFEFEDSESVQILHRVLQDGCRLLKVLDLRGAPLDKIPSEVFKLYYLKYLSLRRTNIKIIPKSIGNLQNLETLDLKHCRVTELPIQILKLCKLRHLLVYSYISARDTFSSGHPQSFKAPYEIGCCLTALQKLCYIDADEIDGIKIVREIGRLTQLRRLCIKKLKREDGKDLSSSLAKLINLRSLCIFAVDEGEVMDLDHYVPPFTFSVLRKVVLHGRLEKLPQWMHFLHGLTEVQLGWSRLREDLLQHLGVLPNLVSLKLYNFAYEGERLSFVGRGFQSLKRLWLFKLRGLRWIEIERGSMPYLETLSVWHCNLMGELPSGIEHLSNLQYIELGDLSVEFIDTLVRQKLEAGEEWKLAHVPKVNIFSLVDGQWRDLLL